MNLSDSIAHVAATAGMAATGGALKSSGAPTSFFHSAAVTHYGPDGNEKATVGTMSFANLKLAVDGSFAGGQITHNVATPDGRPVHDSTLQVAAGGQLTQAQTIIHNHNDAGVAGVLTADLSGLQWTDSGKIHTGSINLVAKHPTTGAQTAAGKLVFQNEKLVSGAVTHYAADSPNTVESVTEMDYTGLTVLGTKVVGGQLKVTRKQPDQKVSSTSQVSFHEDGSGRVQQIQTTNLDPRTGSVKSQVASDYSNINYDARNVITSGDVHIQVTAPDQSPVSHAVVTFANAVPQSSQTWRFQGNAQSARVVTDFRNATFDNHNRVLSGAVKVDVFDGSDNPLVSSNVTYDGAGGVANKQTQKFPPVASSAPPRPFQAIAQAWTNAGARPAPVKLPIKTVASAPPNAKNTLRKDGTLEQSVVTTSANGVPVSASVTHYDTDGKTIVNTYEVDLSKVTMAGGAQGKPSGAVAVTELTAGVRKNSDSVFSY